MERKNRIEYSNQIMILEEDRREHTNFGSKIMDAKCSAYIILTQYHDGTFEVESCLNTLIFLDSCLFNIKTRTYIIGRLYQRLIIVSISPVHLYNDIRALNFSLFWYFTVATWEGMDDTWNGRFMCFNEPL